MARTIFALLATVLIYVAYATVGVVLACREHYIAAVVVMVLAATTRVHINDDSP